MGEWLSLPLTLLVICGFFYGMARAAGQASPPPPPIEIPPLWKVSKGHCPGCRCKPPATAGEREGK